MSEFDSTWKNKKILITGGSMGLGKALAVRLLQRHAQVAVVARGRDRLEALKREFPRLAIIPGDLSQKTDIHPIALEAVQALQGLDLLINNASALGPEGLKLLADTECEDFETALQTNVLGPFRLTQALMGPLFESRGTVLNIISDAALHAYPRWGAYGSSKAALLHMTRIWNEESKPLGIRMLCLDPGDMDTELHRRAVPDAAVAELKDPALSAREIIAFLEREVGHVAASGHASA